MKTIPLTQGKVALVDDEDFEALSAYKWQTERRFDGSWCAVRVGRWDRGRHKVYMPRQIMCPPPGVVVIHVDGDYLNNRRSNLRLCTYSEIRQRASSELHSSRYKGVSRHKGSRAWQAAIMKERKCYHLGYFDDERQAAEAYNAAARDLYGEFAYQNVLDEQGP